MALIWCAARGKSKKLLVLSLDQKSGTNLVSEGTMLGSPMDKRYILMRIQDSVGIQDDMKRVAHRGG
jgi:hypothetical protein